MAAPYSQDLREWAAASVASTPCSKSSAPSPASHPSSGWPCAQKKARPRSPTWKPGFAPNGEHSSTRLSRHAPAAKVIDYMLKRWTGFIRFLADGQLCLSNKRLDRRNDRLGKIVDALLITPCIFMIANRLGDL